MATLNIRKIPDDLYARLRVRAAEEGESMEGFVRARLDRLIPPSAEGGSEPAPGSLTPDAAQKRFRALFDEKPPKDLVGELSRERREQAARE
mgnify:CR=1 FL=1